MSKLTAAISLWGNDSFSRVIRSELLTLDASLLPLQSALSAGHYVSDEAFDITILNCSECKDNIIVKAGVFFRGVISGCNCADDPSPGNASTNEYCELQFTINKISAEFNVVLLAE
ncbi:MAG: hypothetical protein OEX03_00435 [Gammaproteobacteria bacterium]|nr:hypothetical protein [Gammaproteobacteria bacterium]